jgi:hypothetical protein
VVYEEFALAAWVSSSGAAPLMAGLTSMAPASAVDGQRVVACGGGGRDRSRPLPPQENWLRAFPVYEADVGALVLLSWTSLW